MGGGFSYTRTQFIPGDGVGDACDCNDNICTDGIDIYGQPICPGGDPVCCVDSDGDGYSVTGGNCGSVDCDDTNPAAHPGGNDSNCNGVDENCIGGPDDGYVPMPTECGTGFCYDTGSLICTSGNVVNTCTPKPPVTMYLDADNDGYGNAQSIQGCTLQTGYVLVEGDCNDTDPTTNPGASDICGFNNNVINKNCNASDDSQLHCGEFCGDLDGDGYVTAATQNVWNPLQWLVCGWIKQGGECNDNDAAIHPGATELCDGVDNNCDGKVDEGCAATNKQDALAILAALSSSDSKSRNELNKGIKELKESLGNLDSAGDKHIYWFDSAHLYCRHGYKVFDHEKKAVHHLLKVTDPAIKGQVDGAIAMIVQADRLLAQTAISEAPAGKDKDKATAKFSKAEAETKLEHKIHYYRSAWKYVNKHCDKNLAVSCIEEMTMTSPIGDVVTLVGDDLDPKDTTFTDVEDNSVTVDTSCKKCLVAGQKVKDWTITDIVANQNMTARCATK